MASASFRTLDDLDVDNRRVFVRVDFNVPLDENGEVRDDTRIVSAIPTLKALRDRGAKLVVASHLGRPKGKVNPKYSMEPVGGRLSELLDCEVRLPDQVTGPAATKLVGELRPGQIVLLQNLRFDPGETANDPKFAESLAELCDTYVNDAFGACHRAHASVVGVPALIAEHGAGRLLQAELRALPGLVESPKHPFVAIVGGAKVSDKLGVLTALLDRFKAGDALIIGGAMANTFLAACGTDMAASLQESERYADCQAVIKGAAARDITLVLPTDLRYGPSTDAHDAKVHVVASGDLPRGQMALDVGPATVERCRKTIEAARTLFWNGPMGLFENEAFAQGTLAVASQVARASGFSVVGGGDSVAALRQAGLTDKIGHVSTGGGASLEFIEGKVLPGVAALIHSQGKQR